MLQLLTAKPVLYVCNVEEASAASGNAQSDRVAEMAASARGGVGGDLGPDRGGDLAQLPEDEAAMFLEEMGLHEAGLDRLIRAGYALLGLQTYFTVGPKEARAWTITEGDAGPAGGGGDPRRFREGVHPGGNRRPMTTISPGTARRGRRKRASSGSRARPTRCKDGDVLHFLFNG